jgi:hypothetical protein
MQRGPAGEADETCKRSSAKPALCESKIRQKIPNFYPNVLESDPLPTTAVAVRGQVKS